MSDALTFDTVLVRMGRDELPWGQAWVTDFPAFADRFTLHDSVWVGVFLNVRETNEAVLVVEWDAHWLPEPLRTECMEGSPAPPNRGNPFLCMRLSELCAVRLCGYETTLSDRPIRGAESSVQNGVNVLEIADIVGGTVRLEFAGQMEFIGIRSEDGRVLDLAKIGPRLEPAAPAKPWWRFW